MPENLLDKQTHELLLDWSNKLNGMIDRRKPVKYLMIILITMPVVLILIAWLQGNYQFTAVMGLPILAFNYLGKLQTCDDKIEKIRLLTIIGDVDRLIKAVDELSGYGKFDSVFDHLKLILKV